MARRGFTLQDRACLQSVFMDKVLSEAGNPIF